MKHYRSFAEYALESSESKGLSSLPVPVVKFVGRESALSLPVITIIGVQVRVKFCRYNTVRGGVPGTPGMYYEKRLAAAG